MKEKPVIFTRRTQGTQSCLFVIAVLDLTITDFFGFIGLEYIMSLKPYYLSSISSVKNIFDLITLFTLKQNKVIRLLFSRAVESTKVIRH